MKHISLILLLGLAGLHAQDRTAWYRDAKFGMFIHWGPYSLASVEASWPIMTPQKTGPQAISEAEYRALPARFNPVKFDPRAWVKLAKAAGQRYMVITTKHHDGFAMFDSAYTKYKITQTPYGKDIIKELADAAKAGGMPLGFYYSPPDMDHPGFRDTSKLSAANWQGEPWRPEWPLYLGYMELQLRELLTRYGEVAIIWFDGLGHQEKYDGYRFHKLIHEMQPKTLINNRIGLPGDYDTPEQFVPKVTPTRKGALYRGTEIPQEAAAGAPPAPEDFRLWETCMTINNQWGYNRNDHNFKSAGKLIQTLVDVASKGGNLLLNVGPTPEGEIQPEFQERLLTMGAWLNTNGESIYGTTYGPLQNLAFGRTTAKGKMVYLHVFDWPKDGTLAMSGLQPRVAQATLLAGGTKVAFEQRGDTLTLKLPAQSPDANVSVIALRTR